MDAEAKKCAVCPRKCNVVRGTGTGYCKTGPNLKIAKAYLHKWEEPCISGHNGSGTVFFSGCNLRCVFCQNHLISQQDCGIEVSASQLGKIFLLLQEKGAHNINLVSPSHYCVQIRKALIEVSGELHLPVVYNSNGYDSPQNLKLMEGLVNVYLPDLKYFRNETSLKYSDAPHYFETASSAILEMYRQVGKIRYDSNGLIKSGLIIRHMILPGHAGESIKILDWINSALPAADISVSLMSQYTPVFKAENYPVINRRIIRKEYEKVLNHFLKLGFPEGYIQERDSAEEKYIPDFDLEGVIFDHDTLPPSNNNA